MKSTTEGIALILCLLILSVESARAGVASQIVMDQRKDLVRGVDPLIIVGEDVSEMLGLPLEGFRLFACRRGALFPIPFQIDERDSEGLYVLPEGEEPNRDRGSRGEEKEKPDALDTNDEIVFMASDLGDRLPRAGWPSVLRNGVEIQVLDRVSGRAGWAYLFWFDRPPPASGKDYVRYARREDRIYTPRFSLGYSPKKDLVYTTYMAIDPSDRGDGVDVMDRINIRFSATIFLRSITFSRNEDDFVSEVIAYKDGPIRVMRRVANSMRLVLGLRTPKIIAYSMYYRDAIETPNVLHLPVSLSVVARSVYFEGGTDYNRRAFGMRFTDSNNPEGTLVDGRMSPEERVLDLGEHAWNLTAGEQGIILNRIEMGPGLKGVLTKELIYRDDMFGSNAPEDEVGCTPKIGFFLKNILALKKGTYRYNARFYFLPDTKPETIKEYLAILDNPLEIRVHPTP